MQAVILRCVAWLNNTSVWRLDDQTGTTDTAWAATAMKARSILQTMVDGICASLPTHVGYRQRDGKYKKIRPRPHGLESIATVEVVPAVESPNEEGEPVYELGGYFLLWSLLVASSAFFIPQYQSSWITAKVLEIVRHCGLDEEMLMTWIAARPEHLLFGESPRSSLSFC